MSCRWIACIYIYGIFICSFVGRFVCLFVCPAEPHFFMQKNNNITKRFRNFFSSRCCYFLFIEWMTRILTSIHKLINVIDFVFQMKCDKLYGKIMPLQILFNEKNRRKIKYKSNSTWIAKRRKKRNQWHQRHTDTHWTKKQTSIFMIFGPGD